MAARNRFEAGSERFGSQFQDQNFEARPSYDLDSEFDMADTMYDEDGEQNLFGMPGGHFHMEPTMYGQNSGMTDFSQSQPWSNSNHTHENFGVASTSGASFAPRSVQREIVDSRSGKVVEQFGQITPPNDDTAEPSDKSSRKRSAPRESEEEDIAKMNRTQRARNAANKRHSKPKASKTENSQEDISDPEDGDKDRSKSSSQQREKNRVAAAKCRAKKKANSEGMQETHREGARENSYLHREVRELRDQKAFLRNALLQHEPGVCQCHGIHRFNMAQAQQLAFGVGAMVPQPTSPSQDSDYPGQTPTSDGSGSGGRSGSGMMDSSRRMSGPSRQQAIGEPSNYTFGHITSPDSAMSTLDTSHMPHQFADFLHSSPRGRASFS